MTWTAVAIGGAAVVGGVAANSAANKQAGAAGQASQVEQNMFNQTQGNLQDWMNSGRQANYTLQNLLGLKTGSVDAGFDQNAPLSKAFSLQDFQASPAYNFNLEQGMNAINKGAAARGNLYAPQTLQDLGKFTQGTASNEFQNAFSNYNTNQNNIFSRLQTLSGQGANAATNLGGFGAQTAGQIGGNIIGAGNANAAGIVGGANAINSGVGSYYNQQLMQQILAQQQQPTYAPGGNFSNQG